MNNNKFDISLHLHKLVPNEKIKNKYYCPVCNGNDFSVNPKTFEWGCYNKGCGSKQIIQALNPWDEYKKQSGNNYPSTARKLSRDERAITAKVDTQAAINPNNTIKPNIALFIDKTNYFPVERKADSNMTSYFYSENKKMVRVDYVDIATDERKKKVYPNHQNEFGRWISGKGSQPWGLYQFNALTDNVMGNWLIIVEGEKCVEALLDRGILATTPHTTEYSEKHLNAPLETLKANGMKGIIIFPDNDETGKNKAGKLTAIADKLAIPNVVIPMTDYDPELKEGGDIVDLIVTHFSSSNMIEFKERFIQRLERDVHSALQRKYLKAELVIPENDVISRDITVDTGNLTQQSTQKVTHAMSTDLMIEDLAGSLIFHSEQSTWREWNGKYWESKAVIMVQQQIVRWHEKTNIPYNTTQFIEASQRLLSLKLAKKQWISANPLKFVNFNNGVLELETGNLREHNPNDYFISCLPYDYHPLDSLANDHLESLKAHCPNTYSFFSQAMKQDSQKMLKLLAIINGVVKYQFHKLQQFVYIVGDPASGKGTFTRLLKEIVGKGNHQSTRISNLNSDYHVATVIDKQLVSCDDEDKQSGNYANLKSMTGGDAVSYRPIYGKPASSPFYGTLVVVANKDVFAGATTGLDRRKCHVEFNNSIPQKQRDYRLDEKLQAEIPNLLPIALSMSDSLVEDSIKGIGQGYIADFAVSDWINKISSDSVASWLDSNVVFSESAQTMLGAKTGKNESLYPNYCNYCFESNLKPCSAIEFSSRVLGHCKELERDVTCKRTNKGMRFNGLRIRSDGDEDLPLSESICAIEKNTKKCALSTPIYTQQGLEAPKSVHSPLHCAEKVCTPGKETEIEAVEEINDPDSSEKDKSVESAEILCTSAEILGESVDLKPLHSKESVESAEILGIFSEPTHIEEKATTSSCPIGYRVKWQDTILYMPLGKNPKPMKGIVTDVSKEHNLGITREDSKLTFVHRRSVISILE